MKKLIHFSTLLLFSWCLSLAGLQQAWASHAQAGQLTYQYVSTATNGDQTYTVRVDFFRDCSGIPAPASFLLSAQSSCGGTARTTTLTRLGTPVVGTPYCASIQALAVCPENSSAPANAPPNFSTTTFQGTIVLPPAAEWILSVEESARPSVANLANGNTLRLEARLNSLITPFGGGTPIVVRNSSPVFSTLNLPVPFVYVNQESTISFLAVDNIDVTNGRADSLVYSLDRPLSGCNTFETYAAYPTTGCRTGIDPRCSSRLLSCAGIAGNLYSATLPIPVSNDTLRPTPCNPAAITNGTIRPQFVFTANQASFRFTPNRFVNTPSSSGDTKYAVVGKVTEYRKINGRYYIVGSARRDFLVIVIRGAGNQTPNNPSGTAGPPRSGVVLNITRDTTDLRVNTCNYSRVRFNFTDPDNTSATPPSPLQRLRVYYPANINTTLLQGGDIGTFVLSGDDTPTPSATFYFQPTSALRNTTILIPLRIEDDGCPAKGIQYRTIRIRVVDFPGAQARAAVAAPGLGGSTPSVPVICPGGSIQINGSVDRPDSVRVATTGVVNTQTYSFQWVAVNGTPATSGLPAITNVRNIVVRPTVTTRYRLFIAPLQGFGVGVCGDTTSVLVRVAPEPVASITLANPITSRVCAGANVILQGQVSRPNDRLTDVYTYRYIGPTGTVISSGSGTIPPQTISAPTAVGRYTYTLTVLGETQYGCDATATTQIEVVAPPALQVTTTNAYICPNGSATLSALARPAANFTDTYIYTWTGTGVPAGTTGPTLTVRPTTTTTYTVTAVGDVQTGCAVAGTVTVNVTPAVVPLFAATDSLNAANQRTAVRPPVKYLFANLTNEALITDPTAAFTYRWTYQRVRDNIGSAVSDPETEFAITTSRATPATTPLLAAAGLYVIRLTATARVGGNSCSSVTATRSVRVPEVTIPNIITPNGDNANDVFMVSGTGTKSKLDVYNRWGRKVYEQANYQNNWGGDNQPAGVYYYLLTNSVNGAQTKGWLEIVR